MFDNRWRDHLQGRTHANFMLQVEGLVPRLRAGVTKVLEGLEQSSS